MNKDAIIFIKENLTEEADTIFSKGDYKGAADLSLTRSKKCFDAIVASAGYETLVCERWYPNEKSYPILTMCLRMTELKRKQRHTGCRGAIDPSQWAAHVAKEEQEQEEEVETETLTDDIEKNESEVKVQDAEVEEESGNVVPIQKKDDGKNYDEIGLELLQEYNVIIGEIVKTDRLVQLDRTKKQRISEYQTLYTVVLNLNAQISHPKYRDYLKAIRILAHMLRSTSS